MKWRAPGLAAALARASAVAQDAPMSQSLAVGASCALVVLNGARPAAGNFALFVLSIPGQATLAKHGFTAVAVP